MKYTILLIFLIFSISLLLIIPTIWCYDPTLLVNLKYNSNIDIKEFTKPSLFIVTFNNNKQHFLDQILICKEAIKSNIKINIVAQKNSDIITSFLKKLPLFPKYKLLYTGNKLSQKIKTTLEKEHVIIFLKEDWKNKGPYYILKDTNKPIVLVKIKDNDNKLFFNKNFNIEYKELNKYPIDKGPEEFMKWIKSELYN